VEEFLEGLPNTSLLVREEAEGHVVGEKLHQWWFLVMGSGKPAPHMASRFAMEMLMTFAACLQRVVIVLEILCDQTCQQGLSPYSPSSEIDLPLSLN